MYVLESILNGYRGHRGCGAGPDDAAAAVGTTAGLIAVFDATTVVAGRRRSVGHFQVQLDLRSERLSPSDAVHRARLVLGQLPDDDFVRPEPQVPGRAERRPDAHVTLATGRPTPRSLPLHSACSANNGVYNIVNQRVIYRTPDKSIRIYYYYNNMS